MSTHEEYGHVSHALFSYPFWSIFVSFSPIGPSFKNMAMFPNYLLPCPFTSILCSHYVLLAHQSGIWPCFWWFTPISILCLFGFLCPTCPSIQSMAMFFIICSHIHFALFVFLCHACPSLKKMAIFVMNYSSNYIYIRGSFHTFCLIAMFVNNLHKFLSTMCNYYLNLTCDRRSHMREREREREREIPQLFYKAEKA